MILEIFSNLNDSIIVKGSWCNVWARWCLLSARSVSVLTPGYPGVVFRLLPLVS